ncbi:hypothetical protein [Mesorhizobium sp. M0208]|uniref:hypothetical protein n=1 Tax=Mesorhizobium sp. M0208 TaxID=2956916 RepID=UPI003335EA9D
MTDIDDLLGAVKRSATSLQDSLRTEPTNYSYAGWGKFVDSNSPVFQIGPYGTCSGVLANQIAFPATDVEARIRAQLRHFWDQKPHGKLFPQNVRLAFVVMTLAKSTDTELVALRDEIVAELLNRQNGDGSWGDALPHANAPAGGRPDSTAWVTLAFARMNRNHSAARKGAEYLVSRLVRDNKAELLSPIAIAAAVYAIGGEKISPELRRQAIAIVESTNVNKEERICFFDYEESGAGGPAAARDYLCFPAFLPTSYLLNSLGRGSNFFESIRLGALRANAVTRLTELMNGNLYRLPGARFASTVDQAAYALSYEQMAEAERFSSLIHRIAAPIYRWSKKSIVINFILPLLILVSAVLTVADPTIIPRFSGIFIGDKAKSMIELSAKYDTVLQVGTAIILYLLPGIPRLGFALVKQKLFGE